MKLRYETTYASPLGSFRIVCEDGYLVGLTLGESSHESEADALCREVSRQLGEYLSGGRRGFELPVRVSGSPFREAVWRELSRVPYGEVVTYGELARKIGAPGASRAVGGALNANPVAIVLPCHRVVGTSGIGGYAYGSELKRRLLELERNFK